MNKLFAVIFSMIIIGASLSGCMSESVDTSKELQPLIESGTVTGGSVEDLTNINNECHR